MALRYWVGGTGTWDASNTTNWSATNGGTGGASVPSTADTAFINANSGTGTITLGYSPSINAVTFSGYTGTFDGVGSLYTINLIGNASWTFNTAATLLNSPNITFNDTTGATGKTFQGNSKTYGTLTIAGATGGGTLTINGGGTINSITSTKPVAHTLAFATSGTSTFTNWNVSGTSGNVVTINSSTLGTTALISITNTTSGIDYLDVKDITANLAPITFYAGLNTKLRSNVQGVAVTTPTANQYVYVLNSGTSFTTPSNWNNLNNQIHLIGGGGGGSGGYFTTPNGAGGGGGGGGGYTKATNVNLSGSISYAIGAGGTAGNSNSNGGAGGTTTFKSGTYSASGGGAGIATSTSSTAGAGGTGSTYNGGNGGVGALSTVALTGTAGGGGGGAGGLLGNGGNGGNGFASTTMAQVAGGGGGGNGGGSAGGNATSGVGGSGGNNNAGVGGGAATSTFNGGGTNGFVGGSAPSTGSCGIDIFGIGGGGGMGGNSAGASTNSNYAFYGAGGGGGGVSTANAVRPGFNGTQGGIIIVYSLASSINFNFFAFFNGS